MKVAIFIIFIHTIYVYVVYTITNMYYVYIIVYLNNSPAQWANGVADDEPLRLHCH